MAQGMSNTEIAASLVISECTVKGKVSNILSKLHLADRTQAAVFAWQQGVVKRKKLGRQESSSGVEQIENQGRN